MPRLKLADRLHLIVSLFAVGTMIVAVFGLGVAVYYQTEKRIENDLIEQTKTIITDYLELRDNQIGLTERTDGQSLASTLRLFGLNIYIVDTRLAPIAEYGIYRDLIPEQLTKVLVPRPQGFYEDRVMPGAGQYDSYTVPLKSGGAILGYLQVSRLNTDLPAILRIMLTTAIFMLPLITLVALLIANWATKSALNPLRKLVGYVQTIDPEMPEKEILIPESLDPETTLLAKSLNGLIRRVRIVVSRQKEVAENISHEFKTPLTRIVSSLQLLSLKVRGEDKKALAKVITEVVELGQSVDTLLAVATEPRFVMEQPETMRLSPLITEMLTVVPETIAAKVEVPGEMKVAIPPTQMRIILRNLIENAVKYNHKDGQIYITAKQTDSEWSLEVENTVGKSRSRRHGLGLVIVRRICERQGLAIEMDKARPELITVRISGKR